jgi:hypothetical protein
MTTEQNVAPNLVKAAQTQVKLLTEDLRDRSESPEDPWAKDLRNEYDQARKRERTALSWSEWRDGEVDLAAVAWVLSTIFIRFCEDNGLIDAPWITGPCNRYAQAVDNETAFYQADPTRNSRDWLRAGFAALADLPAGKDLVDRKHNLVWRASISADAASNLLNFWRSQNTDGTLTFDFTDESLDTRFLGDLYQDLSDFAKKKYALLQTPIFVEEFILDRTLTPAIEEFGIQSLKLIDPTCGSGHFLLGAFDRLLVQWQTQFPAMDTRIRIQNALDSIYGVDLNPFAVAIARFRITVAALKAEGTKKLKDAPAFKFHIAVGDSLIKDGVQIDLLADADEFVYSNEDISEHHGILERNRYHVVVGNPPYITVKDKALNNRYRQDYKTCKGKYALSVPFMELFFELAIKGEPNKPAGFVGQITSNSFMKREFGKPLIEDLLSGTGSLQYENPVDLQYVIDTSGAYIPGHGTPTVILIGRHRRPVESTMRAVLGLKGEPGQPEDAAHGHAWSEIRDQTEHSGFEGQYISVVDLPRELLSNHPWSLSGGGVGELLETLRRSCRRSVGDLAGRMGFFGVLGADEALLRPLCWGVSGRVGPGWKPLVEGDTVRDFMLRADALAFFPYGDDHEPYRLVEDSENGRELWPYRSEMGNRATFSGRTYFEEGRNWFEWHQLPKDAELHKWSLVIGETGTHNHVVLDRGGKVFKQSAPLIKLSQDAQESDFLSLLGVLNSSVACFWLRQTSQRKAAALQGGGISTEAWSWIQQFNVTRWATVPLPESLATSRARRLDSLAVQLAIEAPNRNVGGGDLAGTLGAARDRWHAVRSEMVFVQEELDWATYRDYGLLEEDLTYQGNGIQSLELGQRAFEIDLARRVATDLEDTRWYERHGSAPLVEPPTSWPADYLAVVQRRLVLMQSNPFIRLLEKPEYKRRWAGESWETMQDRALRDFVLDKLELASLWSDDSGPLALSVAQLADRVRGDSALVEAVRLLRGAVEVDLTSELSKLIAEEAVPFLAAYRYKDSGLRKRAEWESVWELQRREDAGETVSIPVPPKYGSGDFRKTSYWKARGKLDVPKERFTLFNGAERPGDSSAVIGWAGWDHLEQARALARLIVDRSQGDGLSPEALLPLIAGLIELEPWLYQWYGEADALFGGESPAVFFTGFIDSQLSAMGASRADATKWRP